VAAYPLGEPGGTCIRHRQQPLVLRRAQIAAQTTLREGSEFVGKPERVVERLNRLTRPLCVASGPPTARPVRIMSLASDESMSRGRRIVPPSTRGTPYRRQYKPNVASSSATRRSHHTASSSPAAAMTGFERSRRVGPGAVDPVAVPGRDRLEVSARAERAVRSGEDRHGNESFSSKAVKASNGSVAVGPSTAFRRLGR